MTAVLRLYTIYDHPLDQPDSFVVRRWDIVSGQPPIRTDQTWLRDTLEAARAVIAAVHPDAVCIARQEQDEPQIVETWL